MLALQFILGLVIGSFLNVVIYRVPRGESVVRPRSHCTGCGRYLGGLEMVPVVSWVVLGGKCRGCGEKVSVRYPLVELSTGVLFVLVYLRGYSLELVGYYYILVSVLLVAALIDLEFQIIPNRVNLVGFVLGAVWLVVFQPITISAAVFGAMFYGGVLLLTAVVSRGGMGGGDIKLAFVIGLFLGIELSIVAFLGAVFLGAFAGIALILLKLRGRKDYMAFGPFMAVGGIVAVLWGNEIIRWYLSNWGW